MRTIIRIILILFLLLYALVVFQGCDVIKSRKTTHTDSVSTKRSDTGSVHDSTIHSTNENDWFRTTYYIPGRDTVISHILQPINNYIPASPNQPPTIIIQEGGKSKQEFDAHYWDSLFTKKLDSLSYHTTETDKEKHTQAFSFWQLIGIALAGPTVLLLIWGLRTVASKFKIVSRIV